MTHLLTQEWFYWNNKGHWFRILPEIIIIAMVEVSWIELLLFVTQYWGQQDHGGGGGHVGHVLSGWPQAQ